MHYFLLGRKLSHSLSPLFQNLLLKQRGILADYSLLEFEPEQAADVFAHLRAQAAGFNITVPYKQLCMEYIDEITPLAAAVGAVNTVVNDKGRLVGYNTDGQGFLRSLGNLPPILKGKNVLLLGAGGAARMIAMQLLECGARVKIHNRTFEKAEDLAAELQKLFPQGMIQAVEQPQQGMFMIVNATSAGMYPHMEEMPIDDGYLCGVKVVFDCIYNPLKTRFLAAAEQAGAQIIDGLDMLWYQGLAAQHLWGNDFPETLRTEAYTALRMEASKND